MSPWPITSVFRVAGKDSPVIPSSSCSHLAELKLDVEVNLPKGFKVRSSCYNNQYLARFSLSSAASYILKSHGKDGIRVLPDAISDKDKRLRTDLEKELYVIAQLPTPACSECDEHLVGLFACLHCVFLGCKNHITDHANEMGHPVAAEFNSMQIWCGKCTDYITDVDCERVVSHERIRMANIVTQCLDPLFVRTTAFNWAPNNQEMEMVHLSFLF
jgi:hypothetical protein